MKSVVSRSFTVVALFAAMALSFVVGSWRVLQSPADTTHVITIGRVPFGTTLSFPIPLENSTDQRVVVAGMRLPCGWEVLNLPPSLLPRSKYSLTIKIPAEYSQAGELSEKVAVLLQGPRDYTITSVIVGTIYRTTEVDPPLLHIPPMRADQNVRVHLAIRRIDGGPMDICRLESDALQGMTWKPIADSGAEIEGMFRPRKQPGHYATSLAIYYQDLPDSPVKVKIESEIMAVYEVSARVIVMPKQGDFCETYVSGPNVEGLRLARVPRNVEASLSPGNGKNIVLRCRYRGSKARQEYLADKLVLKTGNAGQPFIEIPVYGVSQ